MLRTSVFVPVSPAGGEKYLKKGYRKEIKVVRPRSASIFCRNCRRFVIAVAHRPGQPADETNYISVESVCQTGGKEGRNISSVA